ncbi:MAG TPA: SDR family oxidoreductase [Xanthomonadaceae bacterium]|nr:SDR family oxidoreductase [Xanthomonadaceae bacterium]
MRVLVTGASGFIGAHIVAALRAAGHEVVRALRSPPLGAVDAVACDFGRDTDPAVWVPRLAGVGAVVNCAGILRERGADRFEAVHVATPRALAQACAQVGIAGWVQISALGDPVDGEFLASKHRGDAAVLEALPDAVVLRPSLVYAAEGSYGGTTLLRAVAAAPVLALPRGGSQRIAPIAAADVGAAVVAALQRAPAAGQRIELVGPRALSLRDYLLAIRRWLGLPPPRTLAVPAPLARLAARIGEWVGRGPLGLTLWRMLERGNLGGEDAATRMRELLGLSPRDIDAVLAARPAAAADRWHARLYWLAPLLRVALALLWLASGVVGWLWSQADIQALLAPTGLGPDAALVLARAGASIDLVLGAALLAGRWVRPVLALMALQLLAYTAFVGIVLPAAWLDPWGGLLKNLVVLVALAVAAATAERS